MFVNVNVYLQARGYRYVNFAVCYLPRYVIYYWCLLS